MPGLDEDELGLESLLIRAANAGAQFAGMTLMQFEPGQRENFLAHVTTAYPECASKFRRIIGRRPPTDEEKQTLFAHFEAHLTRLGLAPINQVTAPKPRAVKAAPSQLTLFDASPL